MTEEDEKEEHTLEIHYRIYRRGSWYFLEYKHGDKMFETVSDVHIDSQGVKHVTKRQFGGKEQALDYLESRIVPFILPPEQVESGIRKYPFKV